MDNLCGIWIAPDGRAHLSVARPDGTREERAEDFRPFAWLAGPPAADATLPPGAAVEQLNGDGAFTALAHADNPAAFEALLAFTKAAALAHDAIRPQESQWLLQRRARLFAGLPFGRLRRCQLDIETGSAPGSFSDAARPGDRVLAIGLRCDGRDRTLVLAEMSDAAEKTLLEELNTVLREEDPDVIEGHNIFRFDLDYLRQRAKRHKVPCAWGRFGQRATFRNSRLKVAERMVDFPRCDLPGRAVVDTLLFVQLHDITARELASHGLKEAARHFGITRDADARTYLDGRKIAATFSADRARFLAYLADDLRETAGLADLLLPTYFEQARAFPILLQEATLRGTTAKIDLLFLEEYYHARQACPAPPEIAPFEGGFTRSFQEGVFRHVLHFDVASLYPSLLLAIGRNPRHDTLGVFVPMLARLRDYRLKYKQLAKTAPTADERAEAQARQAAFKILINSFYGYLGFSGARFGDGELAAEVTRRGRELMQTLITEFEKNGGTILEADTDGLYLSSERDFAAPEGLLARVAPVLPPGIELEFDGRYDAMWCYKAKNYALRDGAKIILRGSALRSRATEPFLKNLTDRLIYFLLGATAESPLALLGALREKISAGALPVAELAKTESLGQSPDAYERFVAEGGKPRRAAAEAALRLTPRPGLGDRVAYYITAKSKGKTADWQRARPVALFDAAAAPYDPAYYLEKLDDWLERHGPLLGVKPSAAPAQDELF
jgi:DNA polymerase I